MNLASQIEHLKQSSSKYLPNALKKYLASENIRKTRLTIVSGIILVLIAIYFLSTGGSNINIPTTKTKFGSFIISLNESGELRAKNSLTISAPRIRGNLKIVYMVPEGTYVKAGDVVCKFDPTEILAKLKEAEAKLEITFSEKEKLVANQKSAMAQMESSLKSAELSYELSKLNMEQIKFEAEIKQQQTRLEHKKNELNFAKTQQEFESKKIIHKSELDKMGLEINQRQNEIEKTQRELKALTVEAPAEGLVVFSPNWANQGRKFSIGDTPWPGSVIMTLPDLSSMESITTVNEVDVSIVKKGQKVIVSLDAFQDSSFVGVISNVASLGKNKTRDSNIKVFEILVDIKNKSEILKPGMTTSNKLIIDEIPNALSVPHESVFKKNGKNFVYVKNGSGFDEQTVELGEKNEDYIIIESGLSKSSVVALRDPNIELESLDNSSGNDNLEIPNSN